MILLLENCEVHREIVNECRNDCPIRKERAFQDSMANTNICTHCQAIKPRSQAPYVNVGGLS